MASEPSGDRARVVILGGGIAGLEALLALGDLAGERVDITLVAPRPDFIYKPLLVDEPFELAAAERHELEPLCAERGARFVQTAAHAIRRADRVVELADGTELPYDYAVLCLGGRFRPAYREAITFPRPERFRIDELLDGGTPPERISFAIPPGVGWPLPLYELAMMTRRRAQEKGLAELRLDVYTPELAPLIIFGRSASEAVAATLAGRRIDVHARTPVSEDESGRLTADGEPLEGPVLALPVIDGPEIDGVPKDDAGFIPIDEYARVRGTERVYAAGDGTNFPIKQGGIGTQQADAAARHIASEAGAAIEPERFHPVLRGKLITGEETLSLRHEVGGEQGEGVASHDYLWWPPHKVGGRYLAPFLAHEHRHDLEPPSRPLDVEVSLPVEWHSDPLMVHPEGPPRVD